MKTLTPTALLGLLLLIPMLATVAGAVVAGEPPTLIIDASQPTRKVSPLHYGLMTEELNHLRISA